MVDSYTITVTPDDQSKSSAVIRIELEPTALRVRGITVHIGAEGAPLPDALADLDFALLIKQATQLSEGRLPTVTPTPPRDPSPTGPRPEQESAAEAEVPRRLPRGSDKGRQPRMPDGQARRVNDMPSDFAVNYWRLGSVTKVAEHYEVPSQIVRGWVRMLRRSGTLPSPWQGKKTSRS
ncbi:hypothetical protein ACFP2T_08045 [Plantactinospora solaniradicis]|uniref:Helix-turn-helix domain-containing protein n=1 Tax=Plantactinospora solaniradicis TaxID=1723736 RepID=A0ABW1K5P9_9ACTN